MFAQGGGGFAVKTLRGGFRAEYAVIPFDNVEVEFEDAVFVGGGFEHGGDGGFLAFADVALPFVEEQVFGKLLADGRAAAFDAAALFVAAHGVAYAVPVEAAVFGKGRVFRGNQCLFQIDGDAVVGNPAVVQGNFPPFAAEFVHPHGHKRAVVRGDGAVGQYAAVNIGVKQDKGGKR